MKLNVAVQMDPIARINIRGDSTFALLLEAQKRGHGLSYYTPDKLSLRGEELVAPVQLLTVRDEPGDHFALGEAKREPLAAFDVILLRQDPPFDLAYITSTHLLERIHPKPEASSLLFLDHETKKLDMQLDVNLRAIVLFYRECADLLRAVLAGGKLSDQEKFKREQHPFDAYERLKSSNLVQRL